jgi:hypothetical protein
MVVPNVLTDAEAIDVTWAREAVKLLVMVEVQFTLAE